MTKVQIRRRGAKIDRGSLVVLFSRRGKEVIFHSIGKVASSSAANGNEGPVLLFDELEVFDRPRTIAELGGSLRRVRKPLQAAKAFGGQYVRLEMDDFDVIRLRIINTDRTVFWYLFGALPESLQIEFATRYAIGVAGYDFPRIRSYSRLTGCLVQFVRGPVANVFLVLREIGKAALQFESQEIRDCVIHSTLGNESTDREYSIGNAVRLVSANADQLFPDVSIAEPGFSTDSEDESPDERGLRLGIPDDLSKIAEQYPVDPRYRDLYSESAVSRIRNRPWTDTII